MPITSAYIAAVLHHVDGNVVVIHTRGFRVDAGEAGVVRARIVIVPSVVRRLARALATVSAIVTSKIIDTTRHKNEQSRVPGRLSSLFELK